MTKEAESGHWTERKTVLEESSKKPEENLLPLRSLRMAGVVMSSQPTRPEQRGPARGAATPRLIEKAACLKRQRRKKRASEQEVLLQARHQWSCAAASSRARLVIQRADSAPVYQAVEEGDLSRRFAQKGRRKKGKPAIPGVCRVRGACVHVHATEKAHFPRQDGTRQLHSALLEGSLCRRCGDWAQVR